MIDLIVQESDLHPKMVQLNSVMYAGSLITQHDECC